MRVTKEILSARNIMRAATTAAFVGAVGIETTRNTPHTSDEQPPVTVYKQLPQPLVTFVTSSSRFHLELKTIPDQKISNPVQASEKTLFDSLSLQTQKKELSSRDDQVIIPPSTELPQQTIIDEITLQSDENNDVEQNTNVAEQLKIEEEPNIAEEKEEAVIINPTRRFRPPYNQTYNRTSCLERRWLINQHFGDLGPNITETMEAVMAAESQCDNNSVNAKTQDYGLMQINILHKSLFEKIYGPWRNIFNIQYNVAIARTIFNQQGLKAWSVCRDILWCG